MNTWTEVTVISTANKTNSIHSLIDLHLSYLLKVLEKTGLEEIIRVELFEKENIEMAFDTQKINEDAEKRIHDYRMCFVAYSS